MELPIHNARDGEKALVSPEDYEALVRYGRWSIQRNKRDGYTTKYVYHSHYDKNDRTKPFHITLHKLLLAPAKGMEVDHINGDGLNNRRENIRVVTRSQNQLNRHNGRNKNVTIAL